MSEAPQLLLAHHLKELKLPTFLREYDRQARRCAGEGTDHVRYLLRLAELELIDRERRMVERRIKTARFPTVKSLDAFDFKAIPSLNKALVLELARAGYIERCENVIALGPSGTGKTHIALGLGLAACQQGLAVGFSAAADNRSWGQKRIQVELARLGYRPPAPEAILPHAADLPSAAQGLRADRRLHHDHSSLN